MKHKSERTPTCIFHKSDFIVTLELYYTQRAEAPEQVKRRPLKASSHLNASNSGKVYRGSMQEHYLHRTIPALVPDSLKDPRNALSSQLQTVHVGNTTAQNSALSSDLLVALGALLLTSFNLISPLSRFGFMFAMIAFALSSFNVFVLASKPIHTSRPVTISLAAFACVSLLMSHTAALGNEARNHISISLKGSAKAQGIASGGLKHSAGQLLGTHRILAVTNKTSIPVDALKAVERSQQALPNSGDLDTEAHENSLDETRVSNESSSDFVEPEREARLPDLNRTFIVNTHRGESW